MVPWRWGFELVVAGGYGTVLFASGWPDRRRGEKGRQTEEETATQDLIFPSSVHLQ